MTRRSWSDAPTGGVRYNPIKPISLALPPFDIPPEPPLRSRASRVRLIGGADIPELEGLNLD